VAEVGHLHDHGHAVLAVATVSHEAVEVRRALDRVAHDVESWGRAVVMSRDVRMFRPFDGHEDDGDEVDWNASDVPDAPWST